MIKTMGRRGTDTEAADATTQPAMHQTMTHGLTRGTGEKS